MGPKKDPFSTIHTYVRDILAFGVRGVCCKRVKVCNNFRILEFREGKEVQGWLARRRLEGGGGGGGGVGGGGGGEGGGGGGGMVVGIIKEGD